MTKVAGTGRRELHRRCGRAGRSGSAYAGGGPESGRQARDCGVQAVTSWFASLRTSNARAAFSVIERAWAGAWGLIREDRRTRGLNLRKGALEGPQMEIAERAALATDEDEHDRTAVPAAPAAKPGARAESGKMKSGAWWPTRKSERGCRGLDSVDGWIDAVAHGSRNLRANPIGPQEACFLSAVMALSSWLHPAGPRRRTIPKESTALCKYAQRR